MQNLDDAQKHAVEQQFHSFCLAVLQNEVKDIHRQRERQLSKEKFFDDLTRDESLEISTELTMTPDVVFAVGDLQVPVYDETLANALEQLSQHKREIILSYYFLEKTEAEIGRLYNCAQQTINYQKKAILKQLKYYLELEELL